MHSIYGINACSKIKIKYLTKLLIDAFKHEQEEKIWDMWISLYPNMSEERNINFSDFKDKILNKKHESRQSYTKKSYSDIENEMDKVVKAYERQVG